jgi:DNA-binding response OmpR family regulator
MRLLLLEDNLTVALEAEHLLLKLGARKVRAAPNFSAAAQFLAEEKVDFAVLDINLGAETTLSLAAEVRDAKVPFIFASGYGLEIRLIELLSRIHAAYRTLDLRRSLQEARAALAEKTQTERVAHGPTLVQCEPIDTS